VEAAEFAMAEVLAAMVERRLTALRDQARATGRLNEFARMTARAVQQMHQQITPLRNSWCQAHGTTPERHGHPGYRPPAALRRLVESRHPTCAFPTCNRRSDRCDLDHTVPHQAHGPTCPCNLAPLCRRHHRTKQTPGWRLFQLWPGLLVWITPAGTWHIVLAHR
jgi:hypothetical protein